MGNESSLRKQQDTLNDIGLSKLLQQYQVLHSPDDTVVKSLSHGGRLTLFQKKLFFQNNSGQKQKQLIAFNHQSQFRQKSYNELDNFKNLINYYTRKIQLTSRQSHNQEQQSNIICLHHFSIKNETTNQVIFPQINPPENKPQRQNLTKMSVCGFQNIFKRNQQQNEPSIVTAKKHLYTVSFLQEFHMDSLENQVMYRAQNNEYFREKEIWSIVYCCCKAAQKMSTSGLKQPMLSPNAIFIDENCSIKVGQWQFVNYYMDSNPSSSISRISQEGEAMVSSEFQMTINLTKSVQSMDILTRYYWPPEGLVQVQGVLRLGELQGGQSQKLGEAKNSQVFCLGMTILQMLTLIPYYQRATYSEKQLSRLINEAVQIRQQMDQVMSQQMTDLLLQMLQWDPPQRFRYKQVIEYIHHVFETNQQIFQESRTLEARSSRFNQIYQLNNQKTDRRQTGSLITEISVDPFLFKNYQSTQQNDSMKQITQRREEGEIRRINYTLSVEQSDQSSNEILMVDHDLQRKKDCFEDSGIMYQGAGDDYNPVHSDGQEEEYSVNNSRQSNQQIQFIDHYQSSNPQPTMFPDKPDTQQMLINGLQQNVQIESPDMDADYQQGNFSQRQYQNHISSSKQFIQSFQYPYALPHQQFSLNQYVPAGWVSNIHVSQQIQLQESRQKDYSMRSFNLNFLNNFNEQLNMKNNISLQSSIQQNKASPRIQNLTDLNSIIKETSSPMSVRNYNMQATLVNPYQSNEEQLFTSPNIMEMIRQFTKKQTHQQTPDFNAIQLPTQKFILKDSQFQSSKKLSFQDYIPFSTTKSIQNQKPYSHGLGSQNFNAPRNQLISQKPNIQEIKNQAITREQFSKGWYQGGKKNGARNGYGTFYYKQGGKYSGYWYNNKMQGHGTLFYPDGRVAYQGQWENDSLHGKGVLINQKPNKIEGQYNFRSFEECENEQYWISYDGWFQNDQKSGYGELLLSNHEKYVGEFRNDMVHGRGKFYKMDGTIFQGIWENNHLITRNS